VRRYPWIIATLPGRWQRASLADNALIRSGLRKTMSVVATEVASTGASLRLTSTTIIVGFFPKVVVPSRHPTERWCLDFRRPFLGIHVRERNSEGGGTGQNQNCCLENRFFPVKNLFFRKFFLRKCPKPSIPKNLCFSENSTPQLYFEPLEWGGNPPNPRQFFGVYLTDFYLDTIILSFKNTFSDRSIIIILRFH